MNCLVGHNLAFRYRGAAVLDGATVVVRPGQVAVLVGPSGSGKTTLLWLLAGLLRPSTGRVVAGDPASAEDAKPADFRAMRFGMVFQHQALWSHLTVVDHLRLVLAGRGLGRAERCERIDALLARLGLERLRRRRPGELSGGERQRLALARALVAEPQWLLLDEPLANLDGPARDELFDLLRRLLADTQAGVLMATHNSAEALRVADHCAVLLDGRIRQAGPAEDVYRRPVSLQVARILGPAAELRGRADGGKLLCDGRVVMDGIDPALGGEASLILRPEDVTFTQTDDGPAEIAGCELAAGGYHVAVRVAGQTVSARHGRRLSSGTRGRLTLVRR